MSELFADEKVELAVTNREQFYQGHILNVVRDHFDYNGVSLAREYSIHPGAVAIVVLDDEQRMLTIKQYRHPIASRDWELPAGLRDVAGESLVLTAQRELAEEVDLVAAEWFVLADVATSPGSSSERVRIFLARGLSATSQPFAREEEEADIVVQWMPIDDVVAAVLAGAVTNSLLAVGALAASAARNSNWSQLRRAAEGHEL